MIPISVCIIGKNEEKHLDTCLSRLKPYPFEIIYVDTGSTDRSKEIASKYTPNVYDFEWCDDFSAARNYSVAKATSDYILILDCDEYLDEIDLETLYQLMTAYPDALGMIKLCNPCNGKKNETLLVGTVARIFNKRYYYFTGSIHEQPTSFVEGTTELPYYDAPLLCTHVGYQLTEAERKQKALRNIKLLEKELAKYPDDPYIYYQLGESYSLGDDYENAYQILDKGFFLDVDESLPYVQHMITLYGNSMLETGRYQKAADLESVFDAFKSYADFVCMLGNAFLKMHRNEEALNLYYYAMTLTDYSVEGANSFIPLHNIGCIYEAYQIYDKAIEAYEKAAALGYAYSAERLADLKER